MPQLSARDLHAALALVDEAHSFADLDSFRTGILPGLEQLVPCDLVGYNEVYPGEEMSLVITHPDPPLAIAGEALSRLAHQHPLIAVQANGDDRTYKISDFLSRREFHSLELYDELYRLLEAEDQIAFGLPGPMVIGIAMNRDRRSFSERDRDHFDSERGATLPRPLTDWLAGAPAAGPPPLTVEGSRGCLTVRATDGTAGRVLILEERCTASAEALRSLGLTRRQSEVLHLAARGRRTEAIADDLFISPRTVRKHLEHIYRRLGVHTREAAVSMARNASRSSP